VKKVFCLGLCICSFSAVFSQNLEAIILSYQNEIEFWAEQNGIGAESKTLSCNGIELYTRPYIYPKCPEAKRYGKGGSVIDCFAGGKFVTSSARELIYKRAYTIIPSEARQVFEPFKTYGNFVNSLVFNPHTLFDSAANSGLNKDFDGDYAYLIFYFGPYSERSADDVFNFQARQTGCGMGKGMLFFPSSFYYALFRINCKGGIELVNYYGVG